MHRSTRSWLTILAVVVAGTLMAACSSQPPRAESGNADVVFPDPARATMPEGTFVNLANLRNVKPGLTKDQVYRLLGAPHFNEGVFHVRKWNYLFDFRDPVTGKVRQCQYQIDFDDRNRSTAEHWKPDSCRAVLDRPVPPPVAEAPEPAPMPARPIRLSTDTMFAFDHADISRAGRQRLDQLLQQVNAASQVQDIRVTGYTDRLGSASYNADLSRRRADAVRRYLVSRGVASNAIEVRGLGETHPLVQCPGKRGASLIRCLAPNRRVELAGIARP